MVVVLPVGVDSESGRLHAQSGFAVMAEKVQLNMRLCVVLQHACQRLDLHADLKAFRQSVFKKVYKEHKDPQEKQKAAKAGRAGENPTYQSQVSQCSGNKAAMLSTFGDNACCPCRPKSCSWQRAINCEAVAVKQ